MSSEPRERFLVCLLVGDGSAWVDGQTMRHGCQMPAKLRSLVGNGSSFQRVRLVVRGSVLILERRSVRRMSIVCWPASLPREVRVLIDVCKRRRRRRRLASPHRCNATAFKVCRGEEGQVGIGRVESGWVVGRESKKCSNGSMLQRRLIVDGAPVQSPLSAIVERIETRVSSVASGREGVRKQKGKGKADETCA